VGRRAFIIPVVLAFGVLSSGSGGSRSEGSRNPFGVILPAPLARSPRGVEVARTLGVAYIRPSSIFLERWNGTCVECDLARGAGLKLVLTVRNQGPGATAPPRDLAAYRSRLGQVLDRTRPALLVVENEENSGLFYSGTPEQYGAELAAACEVAHQKGILCTNGGLVSTLVALLVHDHYLQTGQAAKAQSFASRAFPAEQRRRLASGAAREQIRKGQALLRTYRAAGADLVNFHWYVADTEALEEAVTFLRSQTGLPALTNEVGQWDDDPGWTTTVMSKIVALELPVAVWFGLDGPKARGLVNADGSLRPTGEAFARFCRQNFPARPDTR